MQITHLHTKENALLLRVKFAEEKAVSRAKKTAREFADIFHPEYDAEKFNRYEAAFIEEALEKAHEEPQKESILDYVPSWMQSPRWTSGFRREIAKMNAYGLQRVIKGDLYREETRAFEECRLTNSDKSPRYARNVQPSLTKEGVLAE